jgi:hypothetical protein
VRTEDTEEGDNTEEEDDKKSRMKEKYRKRNKTVIFMTSPVLHCAKKHNPIK